MTAVSGEDLHTERAVLARESPMPDPPARTEGAPAATIDGVRVHGADGALLLDGAALEVRAGEVVWLAGPSGAGKTTLLRTMLGLVPLSSGRVEIAGQDPHGISTTEVGRLAAYVPQDPGDLLFAESLREEIALTLQGQRASAPWTPDELLERIHMSGLATRDPRDLSTGERQRAAIAAVVASRPRVLLLDEPTRGLDHRGVVALAQLVHDVARLGTAVLIASHDERIGPATHRRIEMRGGRIVGTS